MITIVSFGFLHTKQPPVADRVEDVRRRFRDPAAAREAGILDLDGGHPRVRAVVEATPGVPDFVAELVGWCVSREVGRLAIGCAGGKHRAKALAEMVREGMEELGDRARVIHLHAHLPRVIKDEERGIDAPR